MMYLQNHNQHKSCWMGFLEYEPEYPVGNKHKHAKIHTHHTTYLQYRIHNKIHYTAT